MLVADLERAGEEESQAGDAEKSEPDEEGLVQVAPVENGRKHSQG